MRVGQGGSMDGRFMNAHIATVRSAMISGMTMLMVRFTVW